MKYNFLLLLTFLIISPSFGNEEDCETVENEAITLATDIGIPNCLSFTNLMYAKRGTSQKLCEDCRNDFEKRYPERLDPLSKKEIQERAFNASLGEFKKNLISNIIDAVRIRSLPLSENNLIKSVEACRAPTREMLTQGCSSATARSFLSESKAFDEMQQATANEVAKLISGDANFNKQPMLLTRVESSCNFSEKDVLSLHSMVTERAFTPALIEKLSALDPTQFNSTSEIFLQDLGLPLNVLNEIFSSIKSHPVLSSKSSDPKKLLEFVKSIPRPLTPTSFQKALYTKSSNDSVDDNIASNCRDSLKKFKEAICNENFDNGNINLEPFSNLDKLTNINLKSSSSELVGSPELLSANLEVLRLCKTPASINSLKLSRLLNGITPGLTDPQKAQNLSEFSQDKYSLDIGNLKNSICSMNDDSCQTENSFTCQIYEGYKNLKQEGSLEYNLAKSSNFAANALLRSMIGNPSKIDPETKKVLIAQGILPQSDGSLVAQKDIPERQPDYFSKQSVSSAPSAPTVAKANNPSSKVSRTSFNQTATRELYDPGTNYQTSIGSAIMPDFTDLLGESDKNLRSVQDEIMRRLSELPSKRPTSQEQAKQIARDSLRAKGINNSSLERSLTNRLMSASGLPQESTASAGNDDFFNDNQKAVASSSTQTAAEKYKKDGMNRALADMAGARATAGGAASGGRSPSSADGASGAAAEDKPLATVPLSIPEDTRVSLGQALSEKFNKNDPETQMLKVLVSNKKDFILQVGKVNFKVAFDTNKKMNILLDSGDKEEAQRLRPQLEIYFKRLNSLI